MANAFEYIPARTDTPLFIFGDHASKVIPPHLNDLGLSGDDLTRHIAWDIGTADVIRDLCTHFGCGGLLAGFSRLVIDPNRAPDSGSLIPIGSDGTSIPGNQDLTKSQTTARISDYYQPYHDELSRRIGALTDPLVLSVHSFTPQPHMGNARMTEIGLLAKNDMPTALTLQALFTQLDRKFTIGMNRPYSAFDLNHTIDVHVAPLGFRHLALEIRQDLIDSPAGVKDIADVLADRIAPIVNKIPADKLGLIS